jgi:hypothetical protein
MCGLAQENEVQQGVEHAGERTRQGAVPLGRAVDQVNSGGAPGEAAFVEGDQTQ